MPLGMTPVKELKEMQARADAWERKQKAASALKLNMVFREFIPQIFWSLHVESGASVKMVQMFLGHKAPETTLRFYAGTNAESLRAASNVLSATLETGKISKEALSAGCAS